MTTKHRSRLGVLATFLLAACAEDAPEDVPVGEMVIVPGVITTVGSAKTAPCLMFPGGRVTVRRTSDAAGMPGMVDFTIHVKYEKAAPLFPEELLRQECSTDRQHPLPYALYRSMRETIGAFPALDRSVIFVFPGVEDK